MIDFSSLLLPEEEDPQNEKLSREERVAILILQKHDLKRRIAEASAKLDQLPKPIVVDQNGLTWDEAESIEKYHGECQKIQNIIDKDQQEIKMIDNDIKKLLPIHNNMIKVNVKGDVFKVGLFNSEDQYGGVKERLIIDYPQS